MPACSLNRIYPRTPFDRLAGGSLCSSGGLLDFERTNGGQRHLTETCDCKDEGGLELIYRLSPFLAFLSIDLKSHNFKFLVCKIASLLYIFFLVQVLTRLLEIHTNSGRIL